MARSNMFIADRQLGLAAGLTSSSSAGETCGDARILVGGGPLLLTSVLPSGLVMVSCTLVMVILQAYGLGAEELRI
jgi:hypothetical protein